LRIRQTLLAFVLSAVSTTFSADGAPFARDVAQENFSPLSELRQTGHRGRIALPLPDGEVTLDLERFEVFAPGAEIEVFEAGGSRRLPIPRTRFFRGLVGAEMDSLAFISIEPDGQVRGLIVSHDRKFELRPAARNQRRVSIEEIPDETEWADDRFWTCDVEGLAVPKSSPLAAHGEREIAPNTTFATSSASYALNLAVETDFELYSNFSSNLSNLQAFIADLVGKSSTIYARDVRTNLFLTYLGIHTVSGDPFTIVPGASGSWNGSTVTYGTSHALAEFGDRWHNSPPSATLRSASMLVSGKSQQGGVAWIGTICEGDFQCSGGNCGDALFNGHWGGRYGYCGGVGTSVADRTVPDPDAEPDKRAPASGYWPLLQFTHELGHIVGGLHTHCIQLSPADQVTYARQYVDHCVNGCQVGATSVPAEKGTIMSYCHFFGGTNTRFLFGKTGEASYVVPDAITATINAPSPSISVITAPPSLNQGASGAASVTPVGSTISSYAWTATNATIDSGQGTGSINFTATAHPVVLSVVATTSNGCGVTDSVSVTVNTCLPPAITTQPVAKLISTGQSATLSVTASGAGLSYQWYVGASGNTSTPVGGATLSSVAVTPGSTTSYWVRVTGICGSVDSNSVAVTVVTPTASKFFTVAPCRLIDTRLANGPAGGPFLAGRGTRSVFAGGVCGVPVDAKAVALNVTVIPPNANGHLTLYPGNGSLPGSSTINYSKAKIRANNAVVPLSSDGAGTIAVHNGGAVETHFIVDVNGYFN
jgi:hypothetical protein